MRYNILAISYLAVTFTLIFGTTLYLINTLPASVFAEKKAPPQGIRGQVMTISFGCSTLPSLDEPPCDGKETTEVAGPGKKVTISLITRSGSSGAVLSTRDIVTVYTDSQGEYVGNLPVGEYTVCVENKDCSPSLRVEPQVYTVFNPLLKMTRP